MSLRPISIDISDRDILSIQLYSHCEIYSSHRRSTMPTYDFKCEKCGKKFTLQLSISEYEKTRFRCPKCKSTRVKQQIVPFQTVTGKKS